MTFVWSLLTVWATMLCTWSVLSLLERVHPVWNVCVPIGFAGLAAKALAEGRYGTVFLDAWLAFVVMWEYQARTGRVRSHQVAPT